MDSEFSQDIPERMDDSVTSPPPPPPPPHERSITPPSLHSNSSPENYGTDEAPEPEPHQPSAARVRPHETTRGTNTMRRRHAIRVRRVGLYEDDSDDDVVNFIRGRRQEDEVRGVFERKVDKMGSLRFKSGVF